MATDYSPDRIAAMTTELLDAAQKLGVPIGAEHPALDDAAPQPVPDAPQVHSDSTLDDVARDLVTALLAATARWSETSGSRAGGPFGSFLAGMAVPPATPVGDSVEASTVDESGRFGLSFVESLVDSLSAAEPPAETAATAADSPPVDAAPTARRARVGEVTEPITSGNGALGSGAA